MIGIRAVHSATLVRRLTNSDLLRALRSSFANRLVRSRAQRTFNNLYDIPVAARPLASVSGDGLSIKETSVVYTCLGTCHLC
jgi:hypothetical protein